MNLLSLIGVLLFFCGLIIFNLKLISYNRKNAIKNKASPIVHLNNYRVLTIILFIAALVIIYFSQR